MLVRRPGRATVEDGVGGVDVGGVPERCYNCDVPKRNGPDNFWDRVDKSGDCWLWRGRIHAGTGYPELRWGADRRVRKAHVVAWEMAHGPVPAGLELDHLCRTRACVRPDHLEPVSHAENVRRAFRLKTTCRNGHPYADGNVIVDSWSGARRCRTCRSTQNIERKRRQRVHVGPRLGERHPNAKLSETDVRAIRVSSESNDDLASRYGVSRSLIWLVRTRRAWSHLD